MPVDIQRIVERATQQRRDLETAGAQVQGRATGQDDQGRFVAGGAGYLGARPVTSDTMAAGGVIFRHPKGSGRGGR